MREKMDRFPLCWPVGWIVTPASERISMKSWRMPFARIRDSVFRELERFGADEVILSTNLPLNRAGLPYSPDALLEQPGAAVYFSWKKRMMCLACDRYLSVGHNLKAIAMTIEAIRGIERWGASQMMERAFSGFAQLPESVAKDWRDVLQFGKSTPTKTMIEDRFRALARARHPDAGGTREEFEELVKAKAAALQEV
jgi:hypothetical protein